MHSRLAIFLLAALPYSNPTIASGRHSWNQREYAAGVQFPYKSRLMLDTYWLRESCTSCAHGSVNMIGVTLNLYLRQLE